MKIWMKYTALICCGVLVVGLVLMGIGYGLGAKLALNMGSNGVYIAGDTTKKVMDYEKLGESYKNIILDIEVIDLEIIPSKEYGIEAVYYEDDQKPVISSENGTLNISSKRRVEKETIITMGFNFSGTNTARIKLHVPPNKINELLIKGGYGDVNLTGVNADTLRIERTTSDINLSEINAKNLTIRNSYGNIITKKIQAQNYETVGNTCDYDLQDINTDQLKLENSYGKVLMKNIQAKSCTSSSNTSGYELFDVSSDWIDIGTSYGDIEADGLKTNGSKMKVNTGDITLRGELRGKNDLETSYGKAEITTSLKKEEYTYQVNVSYGDISINGEKSEEGLLEQKSNAANSIKLLVKTGDAELTFGR